MGLGLQKPNGGGDYLPVFKFNAVSGDAAIASSVKNEKTGEYDKNETEISFPAKFVFDMENTEIGWMKFSATGVSFAMTTV